MPGCEHCAICFEIKTNETFLSHCQHSFCKDCIEMWKRDHIDCPLCRKILFPTVPLATRKDVTQMEDFNDIRKFLILYFKKKLLVQERDFFYYQEIFQVFLMYPHLFFNEYYFRNIIEQKIIVVRKEKMLNWNLKEKKQMNRLLESLQNVTVVFKK